MPKKKISKSHISTKHERKITKKKRQKIINQERRKKEELKKLDFSKENIISRNNSKEENVVSRNNLSSKEQNLFNFKVNNIQFMNPKQIKELFHKFIETETLDEETPLVYNNSIMHINNIHRLSYFTGDELLKMDRLEMSKITGLSLKIIDKLIKYFNKNTGIRGNQYLHDEYSGDYISIRHYPVHEEYTKLIYGHGVLSVSTFVVPKDTYIITLTKTGVMIALSMFKYLYYFYRNNKHIFKNKDKSRELSADGKALFIFFVKLLKDNKFKKIYEEYLPESIFFKNHLPGDTINNQTIDIDKQSCEYDSSQEMNNFCGINFLSDILKDKYNTLKEDVLYLDRIVKSQGPGVYIVCSCRIIPEYFQKDETKIKALMQARSASNQGLNIGENPLMPGKTIYYNPKAQPKQTHLFDYMKPNNLNTMGIKQNNIEVQRIADYRNAKSKKIKHRKKSNVYIPSYNNLLNQYNVKPTLTQKRKTHY